MISIIIPTRCEEKTLPLLLRSIRNQDFKDYEIIVADNNSPDMTREIAKSFGCKIVQGGLPAIGRNNAAKVAKGDYLLFLDADVILPKGFLARLYSKAKKNNLGCCTVRYVPDSNNPMDRMYYIMYNFYAFLVQTVSPLSAGVCIFVKKRLYDKVGGFPEDVIMAEDYAFVSKCSKFGKFRIIISEYVLCNMRRFEKEGRLKILIKYLIGYFHRVLFGEMYNIPFRYVMNGGVNLRNYNKKDKYDFSILGS